MFYSNDRFPWTRVLEDNWPVIREEVARLEPEAFIPWPNQKMYTNEWSLFGFYGFGRRFDLMCEACPRTAEIVARIPGMTTAVLSAMGPGTHLPPHVGSTKAVLRCHLGVMVPDGCRIRVGNEVLAWEDGKAMVFDDTYEHEVWNDSDRRRVNLILDFWKPWSIPGDRLKRLKHRAAIKFNRKRSDVLEFINEQYEAQKAQAERLERIGAEARDAAETVKAP
ncbi:MAG TPA: aspartyl/asparaginyl beta-hydroxylase domain-containing protein [Planctomycetota bacterium]